MDILNRFTREVIFSFEVPEEIQKMPLPKQKGWLILEALKRKTNLRGSDLRGSNLRGSDLRDSNLREIKADLFMILLYAAPEAAALLEAIKNGLRPQHRAQLSDFFWELLRATRPTQIKSAQSLRNGSMNLLS
jgi:hypothetical protein